MVSECKACGREIGGEGHRLLSDNALDTG